MSKETVVLPAVQNLAAAGERPANMTVIEGGRQVSVLERSIEFALKNNVGIEQLQHLLQMKERLDEIDARKAFVAAMAQFKRNPPEILKTKLVEFETRNNGRTSYLHEELGVICELIVKGLAEVGISHRWKPHDAPGKIGVSCVLTHELGHEQDDPPLWAGYDTSGGKNTIQAMSSAAKYLQRYTLLMAVGLAPKGLVEDDGAGAQDIHPAWACEIVQTVQAAKTPDDLRAIRKAAAARCQKEKAVISWNELINPAIKKKAEDEKWINTEQSA